MFPGCLAALLTGPLLLGPGIYRRSEVPRDVEGLWIGLTRGADGWRLRPVQVEARAVALGGGHQTGLDIQPKSPGVLLLLRGLSLALGDRPLSCPSDLREGEGWAEGALLGSRFRLRTETLGLRRIVRLEAGLRTQALAVLPPGEEASWDLLWAGDLDSDGHLDLLLAMAGGATGETRLFLSHRAAPHQVVAQAAIHHYTFGP